MNKPGCVELPLGVTARTLIDEYGGGVWKGRKLKAVIPGGSSVPVVPGEIMMQTNFDYDSLKKAGSSVGTGAVVVMDETTCMVRALQRLSRFYYSESCGQCTPCREGAAKLVALLKAPVALDEGAIRDLEAVMRDASICGLGQAAPNPVNHLLTYFRQDL